jgi:hypothetical protein
MGKKGQRTDPRYQEKRTSYLMHREARTMRDRHSLLGGEFKNVSKRPYPLGCELCGATTNGVLRALVYHHWDDAFPSVGIWVCQKCHKIAEAVEIVDEGKTASATFNHASISEVIAKYRELKPAIEVNYHSSRLL